MPTFKPIIPSGIVTILIVEGNCLARATRPVSIIAGAASRRPLGVLLESEQEFILRGRGSRRLALSAGFVFAPVDSFAMRRPL
jgi:hypothetical protein